MVSFRLGNYGKNIINIDVYIQVIKKTPDHIWKIVFCKIPHGKLIFKIRDLRNHKEHYEA